MSESITCPACGDGPVRAKVNLVAWIEVDSFDAYGEPEPVTELVDIPNFHAYTWKESRSGYTFACTGCGNSWQAWASG